MPDAPEYRTILVVDIEGFGRHGRADPIQVRLRRYLNDWCGTLLSQAGADPTQWVAQDTGDGFLFSVDAHVPRNVLLDRFSTGLAMQLVRHNRTRPMDTHRIRVRLAMHAGDLLRDPDPVHGYAVILAARLLDAEALRACLRATDQPLAVIVSEAIYDNIVRPGYPPMNPIEWCPVLAATKEGPVQAWVHVPGDPKAPVRAGVVIDDAHPGSRLWGRGRRAGFPSA
jgi:hypothetical protein